MRIVPRAPAIRKPPNHEIEIIGAHDLPRVRDAWGALFDASAECNAFYGPDYLEPLACGPLAGRRFRALLAWRRGPGGRTLAGFMPLRLPATPLAPARGFKHPYIVGTAPLLDAQRPTEAAAALMDGLSEIRPGALLILDDVRLDWPAWQAFAEVASLTGRPLAECDIVHRAGVSAKGLPLQIKGKIAQNLRRCSARLSALGQWSASTVEGEEAGRAGLEALLELEASSWKGAAGTALASRPETLAFARAAFDPANLRPRSRFSVLSLDGKPIAVSVHVTGGDHGANIKCAFDETFAACSPGVLLDAAVAEEAKRAPFTAFVDSVAMPGHPVERVWPERLRCGWTAIACDPGVSVAEFEARLAVERMQRAMRRAAADVYHSTIPALRRTIGLI